MSNQPESTVQTVTMLGLSYCPYSKSAKLYLEKRNVDFVYIEVDCLEGQSRDDAAKILARLSPKGALPLTVIGEGELRLIGYNRKKLQEALELMPQRPPAAERAEDPLSAKDKALAKLRALLEMLPIKPEDVPGRAKPGENDTLGLF